jgi:hypothetical protein
MKVGETIDSRKRDPEPEQPAGESGRGARRSQNE